MTLSARRPFDDPATDAAHLLSRVGILVLAFAVPISSVVFRRAVFTLLPVGAGLLIVAATLLPRPPIMGRLTVGLRSIVGVAGLWLLGWSAASLAWTPFPQDASERLLREVGTVLLVVATIATLPERTRVSNLYLYPIGLAAAALATAAAAVIGPAAIGAFQDADSTLQRAVFALVMLFWPAISALAARDRWASAGWLAVAITLAAMAAWTSVALVALACGALVFSLATLSPSRVGLTLGVLIGGLILFGPAIPMVVSPVISGLADVVGDRLPALGDAAESVRIWAALVAAQPMRLVTGHGLDMATRAIQIGFLPPATPSSLLFEIWYDLGAVGAVSAAVLTGAALVAAGRCSATVAPFLLAEIVTGLVVLVWGLDSTQLWWITLLSVAAIAFASVLRGQYRTERPNMRLAVRGVDPPLI